MLSMASILLVGDHDHDSCCFRMPEYVLHVLGSVRKQQLQQMETSRSQQVLLIRADSTKRLLSRGPGAGVQDNESDGLMANLAV